MVEWVKWSTLGWFGYIERTENEEFVKNVYHSSVEGPNRKGRPLGRWKAKVKEYRNERGVRGNGLEWARSRSRRKRRKRTRRGRERVEGLVEGE